MYDLIQQAYKNNSLSNELSDILHSNLSTRNILDKSLTDKVSGMKGKFSDVNKFLEWYSDFKEKYDKMQKTLELYKKLNEFNKRSKK